MTAIRSFQLKYFARGGVGARVGVDWQQNPGYILPGSSVVDGSADSCVRSSTRVLTKAREFEVHATLSLSFVSRPARSVAVPRTVVLRVEARSRSGTASNAGPPLSSIPISTGNPRGCQCSADPRLALSVRSQSGKHRPTLERSGCGHPLELKRGVPFPRRRWQRGRSAADYALDAAEA